MTFDEVLDQVRELLHQRGRVTYRSLKRRFELDDEYLEDLKGELIGAERVAVDEDGKVLVWTGTLPVSGSPSQVPSSQASDQHPQTSSVPSLSQDSALRPQHSSGERRQLTVEFIDLV